MSSASRHGGNHKASRQTAYRSGNGGEIMAWQREIWQKYHLAAYGASTYRHGSLNGVMA